MTNEEAIKRLNKIKAIYNGMDNKSDVKALDMAIESLEQEPILDKIRAEIEAKCCITVGRENDPAITLYDVFEIIDKYKAESEEE